MFNGFNLKKWFDKEVIIIKCGITSQLNWLNKPSFLVYVH